MKLIVYLTFLILAGVVSNFGQSPEVKLMDEFSDVNWEDVLAHLEPFAYILQAQPTKIGLIKTFRQRDSFTAPLFKSAAMRAYLINDLGIEPSRVILQNCRSQEQSTRRQLFLVEPGTAYPPCDESIDVPTKSTKMYSKSDAPQKFIEYLDYVEPDCCAISGSSDAVAKVANTLLATFLNRTPNSRVYLIEYSGHFKWIEYDWAKSEDPVETEVIKTDEPDAAKRLSDQTTSDLFKHSIKKNQISTIYGGYKTDNREVEIWFIPEGGKMPKPNPTYFPKQQASLIDEFGGITPEDMAARLEHLKPIVQKNKKKGYIVVFRGKKQPIGFPIRYSQLLKTYLSFEMGLLQDQFKIVYGGEKEKFTIQLWSAPKMGSIPIENVAAERANVETPILFDSFLYPSDYGGPGCCYIHASTEESKLATIAEIGKILNDNPDSRFVIRFFGSRREPEIGGNADFQRSISKILKKERDYLLNTIGIKKNRIITIDGGYREWREIEYWLVPKDGEIPKARSSVAPFKKD